ncbi:MAG: Alternative oxidase/tellurite resistance protein TehB [Parcubacteria bacterium C7867-007]|nr:MAG: Alternative oxidase/tellurite resistance protein TehB [Parcubacteria bacterium C7867-007]
MEIDQHKNKFGSQAENYTKYRRPYMSEVYDLLFSLVPEDSKRILDIACGTGKSTEPLLRSGLAVDGVDIDPLMIDEAKGQAKVKNLDITYAVSEVEHLPYEDGSFDVVTVGTAFHWFVNETAMNEIKRVLKKDGLLFVYWTLTTKDVPEEDAIPAAIFREFNWEKVPSELRDLEYISSFFKEQDMQNVSTERLPFTHNDSVEDQVGLMKTASSYEVLPEEDKERFIAAIQAALTEQLGSRPYFIYEEEIQVCYGYR